MVFWLNRSRVWMYDANTRRYRRRRVWRRLMKVLVADDDPVSRRLLQSYLQKWGYEVAVSVNGMEAWRLFEQEEFPIVISDWMIPEMDGPELIRRIRASSRPKYVYTILLTARSQKEDLVQGME